MANTRMLRDTVTLKTYTGEDRDGNATYAVSTMHHVYVEPVKASTFDLTGIKPANRIRLFAFHDKTTVTGANSLTKVYRPPKVWELLGAEDKAIAWTMKEGHDVIVHNGQEYTIKTVAEYKAGGLRMWHWEVDAQ